MKPDVAVSADRALLAAHLLALEKALVKHADQPAVADKLKRVIAAKEKEPEALRAKELRTGSRAGRIAGFFGMSSLTYHRPF
jgi:hypothetical protein